MSERGSFGKPLQEVLPLSELTPTHVISPGASIVVKTDRGPTNAVAVDMPFSVIKLPPGEEPRHYPRMGFFEAAEPFTVYYPRHDSRVRKDAGTRLWAYNNPQDGLVEKIPRRNGKKGV